MYALILTNDYSKSKSKLFDATFFGASLSSSRALGPEVERPSIFAIVIGLTPGRRGAVDES